MIELFDNGFVSVFINDDYSDIELRVNINNHPTEDEMRRELCETIVGLVVQLRKNEPEVKKLTDKLKKQHDTSCDVTNQAIRKAAKH